ncbi:MAG TPA: hypothetical protein VFL91_29170 [Thermomicrobiales bacterium]|nr:hypothetical protein [Thermomicrobiales bacterium]
MYDAARAYCPECWEARREVVAATNLRSGSAAAQQARKAGASPTPPADVPLAGAAIDEATFIATILPALRPYSTSQIAKVTGLTTTYVARIKAGQYIPHRRHWDALGSIGALIAARRERLADDTTRAERIRARKLAQYAWEREHGKEHDRRIFVQTIYPRLRDIPVSVLRRETGLAQALLSAIKRGEKVPHPMHWATFARCAGVAWPPTAGDETGRS